MILFKRTKLNHCDNCFLNKNDRCFLPAHPAQESIETIIRNCPCQECVIMMVCDNKCQKRHNYALTYLKKENKMKQNTAPITTPVYTEEQNEKIEEMQKDAQIEYERESHVQEDD